MTGSKHILCFALLWLFSGITVQSQPYYEDGDAGDLILLRLNVDRKVSYDIDAYLLGDNIYLEARSLFDLLKIKYSEPDAETITVEYPENQHTPLSIINAGASPNDNPAVIHFQGGDYLSTKLLKNSLGFHFEFDFRKLHLSLTSTYKLPLIEHIERKSSYGNKDLGDESSTYSPDIILPVKRHLFKGWIADWSVNNSHSLISNRVSAQLGIGGQLLGGSLTLNGSASDRNGINWQSTRGSWKYAVHSTPLLRQIQIGDLYHPNNSGMIFSGFRGFMITNRSNTRPIHFSSFNYNGVLHDGWDAEFYVNRRLRDYALGSDQSEYDFTTPLLYGSNHIQMKFFDPQGFSYQKEYLIQVPYDFLKPGTLEYDLSAGEYASLRGEKYARSSLKVGVTPNITIGGGSTVSLENPWDEWFPFLQSWVRLGKRTLLDGSYMHNYLAAASLRYTFPSSRSISLSAKRYAQNSVLNRSGKEYEVAFSTSFPLNLGFFKPSFFLNSRYQRQYSANQSLSVNSGFSVSMPFRFHVRMNNRLTFRNEEIFLGKPVQAISRVQLSKRMFRKILLRSDFSYSHWHSAITDYSIKLDYRFSTNVMLELNLQRNNLSDVNQYMMRLRIDMPFARHNSTVRSLADIPTLSQTTTGSVLFNKTKGFMLDDQRKVGRASLVLNPFLDYNDNGRPDKGEPRLKNISANIYREAQKQLVRSEGGFAENLMPFERYYVEVHPFSFENPLWQAKHSSYSVRVLPNVINTVDIPVAATGEVSGVLISDDPTINLYGLDVTIRSKDARFSETIQSYSGGHFYFTGLMPGEYEAVLNNDHLADRQLEADKPSISFFIEPDPEGDIVDGITFNVKPINSRESQREEITSNSDLSTYYSIQVGAFKNKENAIRFAEESEERTGYSVSVVFFESQGLYKCHIGKMEKHISARNLLFNLLPHFPYPYIVRIDDGIETIIPFGID